MKRLFALLGLVLLGVVGWRVVDSLSADALGMGIGVLFGMVAGIPTAIFVLVADRRRHEGRDERRNPRYDERRDPRMLPPQQMGYPYYQPQQPPVIVVTGGNGAGQQGFVPAGPQYPTLDAPGWPRPERRYKVVGEEEEWLNS